LGKEANPSKELNLTDLSGLRWKPTDRAEYGGKESYDASFCFWSCGFQARISFSDGRDADGYCAAKANASNDTENLELRISKKPDIFGQIKKAGKVSNDIAKADDPTCH
jgi:hypothetical protein